jgi:predicted RNase H-like HicB family nuclease
VSERGVPDFVAIALRAVRRALRRFEERRDYVDDQHTAQFPPLTITVEEDELDGGWVAECADLPGCVSQGDTKEEAIENIADAIGAILSVRITQATHDHEPHDRHDRDTYSVAL